MKIRLLAIGTRMPSWVDAGFQEYQKRLPPQCGLELVALRPGLRRGGNDPQKAIVAEGAALLAALRDGERVIALDRRGKQWSTEILAQHLAQWLQGGRNIALLIGGPDGLAEPVRKRATQLWSLSDLTLPHGLVRVLVAEQLYRAWSMLQGGPYHRGD